MARVVNHYPHAGSSTPDAQPWDNWLLREAAEPDGTFRSDHGPFTHWKRTLRTEASNDGSTSAIETIDFRLASPLWRPILTPIIKRYLRRPMATPAPWWAPPDRLDERSAFALSLLAIATLAAAYLGTLLSQTITFVADEFEADRGTQGLVTGVTRVGALLALVIVARADKVGRRRMLLAAGTGATLFAIGTALAPTIWVFAGTQTLSRGLSTGFAILIGVNAAEESPAGSRAWVTSVLALCAGLGSGMVLWLVPIADAGTRSWRWLYVVAVGVLPVLWFLRNRITETRRFERLQQGLSAAKAPVTAAMRKRFVMLATVGFALSMFSAPSSNFQNEYLRDERGFSGARISLFSTIVSTPIGIGVAIAGPLADRRGRRLVGAVGVLGGVGFGVLRYGFGGPLMWFAGVLTTVIGAATIPALGVYGPELFPTSRRGMANGLLTCVSVVGSVLGLWFVGEMTQRWSFGRVFAWLAVVPLLSIAVIARYPKTAQRALEELNPEDA